MRVLGIDPGSRVLGWGLVEGAGHSYGASEFGVIKTGARERFSLRLLSLFEEVGTLIGRLEPDVVAVEEAFYASNAKTALKLGQVRGVILLCCEQRELEIAEYSARTVKQTVTGYGNADKRQIQQMVSRLLGLKKIPRPHDAADALGIAICHMHHAKISKRVAGL